MTPIITPIFWESMTVIAVLMAIFAILGSLVFFGFYKKNKQFWGVLAFLFSLIFPWVLVISDVITVLGRTYYVPPLNWSIDLIVWYVGFFLFGITLLFWGLSTFFTSCKKGAQKMVFIIAILFIIAGTLYAIIPIDVAIWTTSPYLLIDYQVGSIFLLIGSFLMMLPVFTRKK